MKKAPKKLWFVILIVIIIVAISVWAMTRKPKIVYTTVPAEAGPLIQTVSETGTVKPIKEIFLNFLTAGKISAVNVKVGDQVSVGQALASLDDSSLNLKKLEIEANIKIAEANLSKINAGASQEAINISRRSLEQAQASQLAASYDQVKAEKTSLENIRQAKKTYDDLVSNSSDTQTTRPSVSPYCSFVTSNVVQPAKTTKFPINSSGGLIPGGAATSSAFYIYVPETSISVKSAFIEIKGFSPSTGTNNISISVNDQSTSTYAVLSSGNSFRILHKVLPDNLNFYPLSNTFNLNSSANLNLSSAVLSLTYSFAP